MQGGRQDGGGGGNMSLEPRSLKAMDLEGFRGGGLYT